MDEYVSYFDALSPIGKIIDTLSNMNADGDPKKAACTEEGTIIIVFHDGEDRFFNVIGNPSYNNGNKIF